MIMNDEPARHRAGVEVRGAADLIDRYGWIQEACGSHSRGFCVIGALSVATENNVSLWTLRFLAEFLPPVTVESIDEYGKLWSEERHNVALWNDQKGRTKEEVLLYLHKFVDEYAPLSPAELND